MLVVTTTPGSLTFTAETDREKDSLRIIADRLKVRDISLIMQTDTMLGQITRATIVLDNFSDRGVTGFPLGTPLTE